MSRDEICARFLDAVPFTLYPFQEEALLSWFESDGGLLVSAPTGMGKTLIAEAAIFEALSDGSRLYYTTPLIALTDQKFREFQDKAEAWGFARDDIGLVTGNRKVNPDARVRVVVAEILLNHLLSGTERFDDVSAVVMDEFHWFNDLERGIVWELGLVLMPKHVRLLLLSATVGNVIEFTGWLDQRHGRRLRLAVTNERRVPLEYRWVQDKLMAEQLPSMISTDDAENRTPALVFCFVRDECWEVAERLKGLPLIDAATRAAIEERLADEDMTKGIGPKLRNMLIRGVGVHHAGVLPRHKEIVEDLFLAKKIPFVVCTETLAAGVNLPARSVVLSTLLKGKPGARKVIAPSSAHQMFGRAGRPQFDPRGFVFCLAHEDDVKIFKWRQKWEQLDLASKDPGILNARKALEKKKPSRRTTEQYWTEGQFQTLIKAGPANLVSRGMIPYRVLVWLLSHTPDLAPVRRFLAGRFADSEQIARFSEQLEVMVGNLAALGYLKRDPASQDRIDVDPKIHDLLVFKSCDPVYGAFLARELATASIQEKVQALESLLDLPPIVVRASGLYDREPGPLEENVMRPLMVAMGVTIARPEPTPEERERKWSLFDDDLEEEERPPTFPKMLKIAFEAKLAVAEDFPVQAKWVAGGVFDASDDFWAFVSSRGLQKNEGIVLRHLLRLALLAAEFRTRTEDPDYETIGARATNACRRVDPSYTDRFLEKQRESGGLD